MACCRLLGALVEPAVWLPLVLPYLTSEAAPAPLRHGAATVLAAALQGARVRGNLLREHVAEVLAAVYDVARASSEQGVLGCCRVALAALAATASCAAVELEERRLVVAAVQLRAAYAAGTAASGSENGYVDAAVVGTYDR